FKLPGLFKANRTSRCRQSSRNSFEKMAHGRRRPHRNYTPNLESLEERIVLHCDTPDVPLFAGPILTTLTSSPSQVLGADLTLGEVFTAAAEVAQTDGNTALATALQDVLVAVGPVHSTIQLGRLLDAETNSDGSLADSQLNVLNVVTSAIELYNYENV